MTTSPRPFDPADAARHGYTRADWDAVDSPELTESELAGLRPMSEARLQLHEALSKVQPDEGTAREKTTVSLPLDTDLVLQLRSSGPGWEGRVNDALRRWIDDAT